MIRTANLVNKIEIMVSIRLIYVKICVKKVDKPPQHNITACIMIHNRN